MSNEFIGKNIVILAPGKSVNDCKTAIQAEISKADTISIALNFCAEDYKPDYIFSSNMRRFAKIQNKTKAKCIITSNMKEATNRDYVVNYASYSLKNPDIIDNSGLMLIKLLISCGVKSVKIAGMDGYSTYYGNNYMNSNLEYDFSKQAKKRNELISCELKELSTVISIDFITPTQYEV